MEGNPFSFSNDINRSCVTSETDEIANVVYNSHDDMTVITPSLSARGHLANLHCFITFAIPPNTWSTRSTPLMTFHPYDSTLDDSDQPESVVMNKDIPSISSQNVISLGKKICRVNQPCTYRFEFSDHTTSLLPAIHFTSAFPGIWRLMNHNYCTFSQSGREVVFQIITSHHYKADEKVHCTLEVTPLEPNIISNRYFDDGATNNNNSVENTIPFLNIEFVIPINAKQMVDYVLQTPQPIPYWDSLRYQPHPLFPFWVIEDIPVFDTTDGDDMTFIFDSRGKITTNGSVAGITPSGSSSKTNGIASFKTGYNIIAIGDTVLSEHDGSFIEGESDAGSDLAGKGESSPVVLINQQGDCIGGILCRMEYAFLLHNYLSTIRFTNHFNILDPRSRFACIATVNNNPVTIGYVTVSPQLDYLYLRSTSTHGFERQKCYVDYLFQGTRALHHVLHQYEFIQTRGQSMVPFEKVIWTTVETSDSFIYPEYSPQEITPLNSFIQARSTQNYITFKMSSLLDVEDIYTVRVLSIRLVFSPEPNAIDITAGRPIGTLKGVYDFGQVECGIPPIHDDITRTPSCRGTPNQTGDGINFTFSSLATTSNIEYFWISFSLGPTNEPFHHPMHLKTVELVFNRPGSLYRSYMQILKTPYLLTQGQNYQPYVYYFPGNPCSSCNIYLGRDTETTIQVKVGTTMIKGKEVVFSLIAERFGDLNQTPLRFKMTPIDNELFEPLPLNHFVCINCIAFTIQKDISAGVPKLFRIMYVDSHHTLSAQFRRVYLKMSIKTPIKPESYFPPFITNGYPIQYQPPINTIFSWNFPQDFVVYDNRNNDPTQHTSATNTGLLIEGTQPNEKVSIRFIPQVPLFMGTEATSFKFHHDIINLRYDYEITQCSGWTPIDNSLSNGIGNISRPSKCIMDVDVENNEMIKCHNHIGVNIPLNDFDFISPSKYSPFQRCTITTIITGEVSNGDKTLDGSNMTYIPFTWRFNRLMNLPPVIQPGQINFPKNAILCNNNYEPFLLATPGEYILNVPSRYQLHKVTDGLDYKIIPNKANLGQLTLTVGTNSKLSSTPSFHKAVVPIYGVIQCSEENLLNPMGYSWHYSFIPFKASHGLLNPSTNKILTPTLGYYVLAADGQVEGDKWAFGTSIKQPYHSDMAAIIPAAISFHSSVRRGATFEIQPSIQLRFPPIAPTIDHLTSFKFPYKYVDPITGVAKQRDLVIPMNLRSHTINPGILVITVDDDINLFSMRSPHRDVFYDLSTDYYTNVNQPPIYGGLFGIGIPAPYDNTLDFRQCYGSKCTPLGKLPILANPDFVWSLAFHAQLFQPQLTQFHINTQLDITDRIWIEMVDYTADPALPLPQDDVVNGNIFSQAPRLNFKPFTYNDPFGRYTVIADNNHIEIDVARTIHVNVPIEFPLEVYSIKKPAVEGGGENYKRTIQYSLDLIQNNEYTVDFPHYDSPPFIIDITPPFHSFVSLNGFHLNSQFTFSFQLGHHMVLTTQSIHIRNLPIQSSLQHNYYTSPEGYLFIISTSVPKLSNEAPELIITLDSAKAIAPGSVITITIPTALTYNNNNRFIEYIYIGSPDGLGENVIPIDWIDLNVHLPVMTPYNAVILPAGASLNDDNTTNQSVPTKNTKNRLSPTICSAPSDNRCMFELKVTTPTGPRGAAEGITIPSDGLKVILDFSYAEQSTRRYYIEPVKSILEDFPAGEYELYYSDDGNTELYRVVRHYDSITANGNDITFDIIPINTNTSHKFTSLYFPMFFTRYQRRGVVDLKLIDVGLGQIVYNAIIPGPGVYHSQLRPILFYTNGGSYINEPLNFGIMGISLLMATNLRSTWTDREKLMPLPYFAEFRFDFLPEDGYNFSTFTSIGLTDINTKTSINSNISPILRAFVPSKSPSTEFFGICTVETLINLHDNEPNTNPERFLSFHIQALNSFSEADIIHLSFGTIIPKLPLQLGGRGDQHGWQFKTFTNRKFLEGQYETQFNPDTPTIITPLHQYDAFQRISAVPVDNLTTGFSIKRKPWVRVLPNLNSLDMIRDDIDQSDLIYTPPQQYLTLTITQQFPDKDEVDGSVIDEDNYSTTWDAFHFEHYDLIHIIIPSFYQIPIGSYQCENTNTSLQWNGYIFIMIFEAGVVPLKSYKCTFPIAVSEKVFNEAILAANLPLLSPDADLTASKVEFLTNNNSNFHLPVLHSTDPSPLLIDQPSPPNVDELYLGFFMPMPVKHPRYHIEAVDLEIQGVPGTLMFDLLDTYLMDSRILSFPLETFPFGMDYNHLGTDYLDQYCVDETNNDVKIAQVRFTEKSVLGLELIFLNPLPVANLHCIMKFTASNTWNHHGLSQNTVAKLRTNNPYVYDSIDAYFTIDFSTTGSLVRPTSIGQIKPIVKVTGTFIKDLTSIVTITGNNFHTQAPFFHPDHPFPLYSSSLTLSFGFEFTNSHHSDPLRTNTTMYCLDLANRPFAIIDFFRLGKNNNNNNNSPSIKNNNNSFSTTSTITTARIDKNNNGIDDGEEKYLATTAQLTFLKELNPQHSWSCHIDIIPRSNDFSSRLPSIIYQPYNEATDSRVTADIEFVEDMNFTENVIVDLGLNHSFEEPNTISSITIYYNSTTTDMGITTPYILRFTLPAPLESLPDFGCTCYVNQVQYENVPFRAYSITQLESRYSLGTHIFTTATQNGLTKIYCTIPQLSTRTIRRYENSGVTFSDIVKEEYRIDYIPQVKLLQYNPQLPSPFGSSTSSTSLSLPRSDFIEVTEASRQLTSYQGEDGLSVSGDEINAIILIAYRPIPLRWNITNLNSLQLIELVSADTITTSATQWVLQSTPNCLSTINPTGDRSDIIAGESPIGIVSLKLVQEQQQCEQFFTPIGFKYAQLPGQLSCNPESITGCYVESSLYAKLGTGTIRSYPTKTYFRPYFYANDTANFYPFDIGTLGYYDYNYSGFDPSSTFVVQIRHEEPGLHFQVQISQLNGTQSILEKYSYDSEIAPTSDYINHIYPRKTENGGGGKLGYGVDILITAGDRWDQLSTLRIAYMVTQLPSPDGITNNYPAMLYFSVKKSTLIDFPQGNFDGNFKEMTFQTRNFTLPEDLPRLPISTLNLSQYQSPFVNISPPFDPITGESKPIARGVTLDFTLTMASLSPLISSLPNVPWLDINMNRPDDKDPLRYLEVDYHLTSPHGLKRLFNGVELDDKVTALSAFCFNKEWSINEPLAVIAIKVSHELIQSQGPNDTIIMKPINLKLVYRVVPLGLTLARFMNDTKHNSVTCTFPLSFVGAPELVHYSNSQDLYTWATIPPVGTVSAIDLVPNHFDGLKTIHRYTTPMASSSLFSDEKSYKVELSQESLSLDRQGDVVFSALGMDVTPGDVFLIKFFSNQTSIQLDLDLSSPQGQPYRFTSIPATAPYCYNLFYPTKSEVIGEFIPADPLTYQPFYGLSSNTFILRITKGSTGAVYPALKCGAVLVAMSSVPFTGHIEISHFTAREFDIMVGAMGSAINVTYQNSINPIFPYCGGELDDPEQVRLCVHDGGTIYSTISQGVDVLAIYDDVIKPFQPLSITFTLTFNPILDSNVYFEVDLTQVRFSAFYGCPGYPMASFYGQDSTNHGHDVLEVTIPEGTRALEVTITCWFSSAQYIQPQYYQIDPETNQFQGRTEINIPMKVTIHDYHHCKRLKTAFSGQFGFRSTWIDNLTYLPTFHYSLSRKISASFALNDLTGNQNSDQNKLGNNGNGNIRDNIQNDVVINNPTKNPLDQKLPLLPFLSGEEVNNFKKWLVDTVRVTLSTKIKGELYNPLDLNKLYIQNQQFDPELQALNIAITTTQFPISKIPMMGIAPFNSPIEWRDKALKDYYIDFHHDFLPSKFTITDDDINGTGPIKKVKERFIPITNITKAGIFFSECQVGHCGGNCQPCNWVMAPCFTTYDCGYGLYCYIELPDQPVVVTETIIDKNTNVISDTLIHDSDTTTNDDVNRQKITYTSSTFDGQHRHAVVKYGIIHQPGMCRPLGYSRDRIRRHNFEKDRLARASSTTTTTSITSKSLSSDNNHISSDIRKLNNYGNYFMYYDSQIQHLPISPSSLLSSTLSSSSHYYSYDEPLINKESSAAIIARVERVFGGDLVDDYQNSYFNNYGVHINTQDTSPISSLSFPSLSLLSVFMCSFAVVIFHLI